MVPVDLVWQSLMSKTGLTEVQVKYIFPLIYANLLACGFKNLTCIEPDENEIEIADWRN